ncbi:hypothetical protein TNCV_4383731 [Trichonephila clavipes]|nr:hypothetical protein TNCV_4383731 [Trichonephila clavipes]
MDADDVMESVGDSLPPRLKYFLAHIFAYDRLGGVAGLSLSLYAQDCGYDPGPGQWIFMKHKIDSVHVV